MSVNPYSAATAATTAAAAAAAAQAGPSSPVSSEDLEYLPPSSRVNVGKRAGELHIAINPSRNADFQSGYNPTVVFLSTPGGSASPDQPPHSARSQSHEGTRESSPSGSPRHSPLPQNIDRKARTLAVLAIDQALTFLEPISSITITNRSDTMAVAEIGRRIPFVVGQLQDSKKALESKKQAADKGDHQRIISDKEHEFNKAAFEDLVREIPRVVAESHNGSTMAILPLINQLKVWLFEYLEKYWEICDQHYSDPESKNKAINEVLQKYKFVSLRQFLWELTSISSIHCTKGEKKICLSLLMRCFENDPVNAVSSEGLYTILGGLIDRLESILNPTSSPTHDWANPRIVAQYVRLLTKAAELWTQLYAEGQTMALFDVFKQRTTNILGAIDKINKNVAADTSRDVWLSCLVANEAFKSLISDVSKIKTCMEAVKKLADSIKKLVSERDFIPLIQGVWKVASDVFNAYGLLQKKWYIELFGVRKALHEIHDPERILELLQSLLVEHEEHVKDWETVGDTIHSIVVLALETPSNRLRYHALMGQQITKFTGSAGGPLFLPGFFHFRHAKMAMTAKITDAIESKFTDSLPRGVYLQHVIKIYAIEIIDALPTTATFNPATTFKPIFKEPVPASGQTSLWSKETVETDAMQTYYDSLDQPVAAGASAAAGAVHSPAMVVGAPSQAYQSPAGAAVAAVAAAGAAAIRPVSKVSSTNRT